MNDAPGYAAPYKVGDTASRVVTFDPPMVRSMATLLGDASPLHQDEAIARASRFGGLIVSGGHYGALMMGVVATFLTARATSVALGFDFQFRKAVKADDTVRIDWRVAEVAYDPKFGGDVVKLEGTLKDSAGGECVRARSSCLVLGPP